ncbi:response regulator transcription factor [Granulosicoccus antarcticus]|uniref:Response regulator protein TodT n=1 Tax=Granulosicoccus antarcticus IMCC3135 TaxID=1192854 RepID=A0A2Z2P515_9GAMM|nr:response regulator [Granulosicoccus antarcticus]ASJ76570.1 Response regulator protein TodT [Granulosicoccus antarcticus IMCC3135]
MNTSTQLVFIVDDDEAVRDSMSMLLDTIDIAHQCFGSAAEFLDFYDGSQRGCLVLDIRMPGMNGLELQKELNRREALLPIIFITGHGDIPMAVDAMRNGALDFMRKPIREQDLLDRIQQALSYEAGERSNRATSENLKNLIATLTLKEHEVFKRVADGQANKVIALELGVSERTVEVHRAHVMQKLCVRSLADLVRINLLSSGQLAG